MGVRFADEQEVHLLLPDGLTKWLVAIQIITHQGDAAGRIMATPTGQPPLGRRQFAILFLLTVLCADKLRRQRHHAVLPGRNNGWRDQRVTIQRLAVFQQLPGAAGTGKLFRAERAGAVQCHQQRAGNADERCQTTLFVQPVTHLRQHRIQRFWCDGVEEVTDLAGRGDLMDTENGLRIA